MKTARRIILALALLLVLSHLCDYLLLRQKTANNHGYGTVTVQRYYSIKQKNGKTEFSTAEPEDVPCVNSLFPHSGFAPCWYLRRHAEKEIDI